ncbi:MAG TPA: hypothetical protein VJY62_06020 [Bacteroidia bacterium]|nr:hypothetical protein [Bacteroidia bacterium]
MKKKYFKLILTAGILFIISSCAKDDADLPTDKYVGEWTCVETPSTGGATTFTISINKSGNEDTLNVYNFDNLGSSEKAIFIVNENSIVIPSQSVSNFAVSGYGTYSSGKLNLNYSVDTDSYTAVCTK